MHEGEKMILSPDALADALIELPGWEFKSKEIIKVYTFETFRDAMEFVNQVAEIAQRLNHHPDIHINYRKVKVICWTHKYNAVTKVDTELASEVEGAWAR